MMLCNKIYKVRKKYGISQTALARVCGVDRNTISRIENCKNYPSILLAYKISNALNQKLTNLFYWSDEIRKF